MSESLRVAAIRGALTNRGWTQRKLATELGVTAQAVTNWLHSKDFPRPAALLKLARTLHLSFDDLVDSGQHAPVIAFRRKAATKTTLENVDRARSLGNLLRPLVAHLQALDEDQLVFRSTSLDYDHIQKLAASRRAAYGVTQTSVLDFERLIGAFAENGAAIVPVMWEGQARPNASYIRLPDENVTFIYLNLNARIEDFKFWMAHELAHILTPSLCGTDEGEDFADALAGALLFPNELAEEVSEKCARLSSAGCLKVLCAYAEHHEVSLFSVYSATNAYRKRYGIPLLPVDAKTIHAVRNKVHGKTVKCVLWDETTPTPEIYVAATKEIFRSPFFDALRKLLLSGAGGVGYVQQVLDVSMADAMAVHATLVR